MSDIKLIDITGIDNSNVKRVTLIITRGCNLSCNYCFEKHFQEQKMSKELAFSSINLYNPMSVKFFGGEPLINRALIRDIIDQYPDKMFEITTNGTYAKKLAPKYWDKFISVNLSIDGLYEFDKNRWRDKSEYDLVIENASYLVGLIGKEKIVCNITVSSENMYDYTILDRMLDLNQELGFTHFDINLVIFDSDNKLRLTESDQEEFIRQCYESFLFSAENDGLFDLTINEAVFAEESFSSTCCAYKSKTQVAVNVDGYNSHCHVAAYYGVDKKAFDDFSKQSKAACPMLDWSARKENISLKFNSVDFKKLAELESLNHALYQRRTSEREILR